MSMKSRIVMVLLVTAMAAAVMLVLNRKASTKQAGTSQPETHKPDAKAVPVLVELFTSEGCSSCPPADEVLARLDQTQPVEGAQVVALSQHVDYWNRLGWTDPFSSAQASERQSQYAAAFGSDQIYTPQMIVDGRTEFVGSNLERAREAIANSAASPKATVTINIRQDGQSAKTASVPISVKIENLPEISNGDTAEVLLAVAESGLRSSVARGENSGRKLNHTAVVRSLSVIGNIDSNKSAFNSEATAQVDKQWKRENLKAVVFVQERASRRVLGVAAISIARQ